jgi:hypothetical protein
VSDREASPAEVGDCPAGGWRFGGGASWLAELVGEAGVAVDFCPASVCDEPASADDWNWASTRRCRSASTSSTSCSIQVEQVSSNNWSAGGTVKIPPHSEHRARWPAADRGTRSGASQLGQCINASMDRSPLDELGEPVYPNVRRIDPPPDDAEFGRPAESSGSP